MKTQISYKWTTIKDSFAKMACRHHQSTHQKDLKLPSSEGLQSPSDWLLHSDICRNVKVSGLLYISLASSSTGHFSWNSRPLPFILWSAGSLCSPRQDLNRDPMHPKVPLCGEDLTQQYPSISSLVVSPHLSLTSNPGFSHGVIHVMSAS